MKVLMIPFQIPIAQGSVHRSLKPITLVAKHFLVIFLEDKKIYYELGLCQFLHFPNEYLMQWKKG